jgi:predicted dehydrogenase
MRFALLGDHPDGVEMAFGLIDSGRHELVAFTTPVEGKPSWGAGARRVGDPEEVLADPAVELVIVAGRPGVRPAQLRRALQSERHVLCVHPADQTPEAAYESALLQKDSGCVLLPILPEGLHPGVRRLAEFVEQVPLTQDHARSPVGAFRLLEVERCSTGEVLDNLGVAGHKPSLPGWDVLRVLGGEVSEVSAFAEGEAPEAGRPVLVSGRFERGGVFQVALVPNQPAASWRLAVVGSAGRAELLFPQGWEGPAFLGWRDGSGEQREEYWERWDPWPALVEAFESALRPDRPPPAEKEGAPATGITASPRGERVAAQPGSGEDRAQALTWQDEVRALELDDAARRSAERRRAHALEYQEASEEVGFKGTMTLVGCALLWGVLVLVIASRWVPRLGWLVLPLLVVFIVLQFLRYAIPRKDQGGGSPGGGGG